jgi:hypothetical protein
VIGQSQCALSAERQRTFRAFVGIANHFPHDPPFSIRGGDSKVVSSILTTPPISSTRKLRAPSFETSHKLMASIPAGRESSSRRHGRATPIATCHKRLAVPAELWSHPVIRPPVRPPLHIHALFRQYPQSALRQDLTSTQHRLEPPCLRGLTFSLQGPLAGSGGGEFHHQPLFLSIVHLKNFIRRVCFLQARGKRVTNRLEVHYCLTVGVKIVRSCPDFA